MSSVPSDLGSHVHHLHLCMYVCVYSACYQLHAGFLLGLFFDPEGRATWSSEMSDDFQQTTWFYIAEASTHHVYFPSM
jgi:hypothetical protein